MFFLDAPSYGGSKSKICHRDLQNEKFYVDLFYARCPKNVPYVTHISLSSDFKEKDTEHCNHRVFTPYGMSYRKTLRIIIRFI